MKIAVAGHRGRLGSWFVRKGCIPIDADCSRKSRVEIALAEIKPDCIVNCAAWTNVDAAEDSANMEAVVAANMHIPYILRQSFDGLLVHLSTGFVFDGKRGPYKEEQEPSPVNSIYAMSKAASENLALMRDPTLVIRTLDLFGLGPKSDFVRAVRDSLALGLPKSLPQNLYGNPTYIPHLAMAIWQAISKELTGIFHIVGCKTLSRYEWGRIIAARFGFDPELIVAGKFVPADNVAPRPLRATLDTGKAVAHELPIYAPDEGLKDIVAREALRADA